MDTIYVYVNVKGRIIEAVPVSVKEARIGIFTTVLDASFSERVNAEEKRDDGYYHRYLNRAAGKIDHNQVWFYEKSPEAARQIFLGVVTKKYNEISKKFDAILEEKERLEKGY